MGTTTTEKFNERQTFDSRKHSQGKKPVDELILEEKCKREYCRALKNKTGFGKNLSLLGLLLGIR